MKWACKIWKGHLLLCPDGYKTIYMNFDIFECIKSSIPKGFYLYIILTQGWHETAFIRPVELKMSRAKSPSGWSTFPFKYKMSSGPHACWATSITEFESRNKHFIDFCSLPYPYLVKTRSLSYSHFCDPFVMPRASRLNNNWKACLGVQHRTFETVCFSLSLNCRRGSISEVAHRHWCAANCLRPASPAPDPKTMPQGSSTIYMRDDCGATAGPANHLASRDWVPSHPYPTLRTHTRDKFTMT